MKKKVLIISGGISKERVISLDTGRQVAKELKKNNYQVKISEPNYQLFKTIKSFKPKIIFNALHGQFGEDGYIQTILESIKIPYTHSGVISSALAITSLDDNRDDVKLAGPGIKGMTRVALGSPDMWAEILLQNKDSVGKVLSEHIDSISEVLKYLKDGQHEEILKFLNKARENRINCFPSD